MKTAISLPDDIFEAAEQTAKILGLSRSELYATAVREFVERYRRDDVTKKLNEVYANNDSMVDSQLQALQAQTLDKDEWE